MERNRSQHFEENKKVLWISGFGAEQKDQEIREICREKGGQPICYIKRVRHKTHIGEVYITYADEETALNALKSMKANFMNCNYARTYGKDARKSTVRSTIKQNPPHQPPSPNETLSTITFKNAGQIRIINVEDVTKLFAIPADKYEAFEQLKANIASAKLEPYVELPKKGDKIAAPYNNKLHRALILEDVKSTEDFVHVYFVDIAERGKVSFNLLKRLPSSYIEIGRCVYAFELKGVNTENSPPYAIKCFRKFIDTEWTMSNLSNGETIIAPRSEVILTRNVCEIRDLNYFMKQMTMTHKMSMDGGTIDVWNPTIGQKQTLVVIDQSDLKKGINAVTFIEQKQYGTFKTNQDYIQQYGAVVERFPPYNPEDGEMFMVKINALWHRACDFKNDPNASYLAEVFLFDNMTMAKVEKSNVRKISEKIMKFPMMTFPAKINGFENKLDAASINKLKIKFKEDDIVEVKNIQSIGDDEYQIEI